MALHWIPAVMLVAALGSWPYAYYTLLRVVVFVAAGLIAWQAYDVSREVTIWVVAFGVVAMLFNPVAPIHLSREIWTVVDLAVAAIFAWHFFASQDRRA
jgi:hypothetical protein